MLDSSAPRLLSVARDRTLVCDHCRVVCLQGLSLTLFQVEYDLEGSGVDDLRLMSVDHIEQSAVPTAMVWYPPLTKESFLMVAGDQVQRYPPLHSTKYEGLIIPPSVQVEVVQFYNKDVSEDSIRTNIWKPHQKV